MFEKIQNLFNTLPNPKQKLLIIAGIVVVAIIFISAVLVLNNSKSFINSGGNIGSQEVSANEPIDIVADFYAAWLNAAKSTSTNPYDGGIASSPLLSPAAQARLTEERAIDASQPDPVLCRVGFPERIKSKVVFQLADKAQILVKTSDTDQSVVTLLRQNDGWYMDKIECSHGDAAIDREFSFDNEGYILKGAAPLDPNYWYLVFTENDEPGHSAPLVFSAESMCDSDVCNPDSFLPIAKAHVYGQMGDASVDVKKIEFIE